MQRRNFKLLINLASQGLSIPPLRRQTAQSIDWVVSNSSNDELDTDDEEEDRPVLIIANNDYPRNNEDRNYQSLLAGMLDPTNTEYEDRMRVVVGLPLEILNQFATTFEDEDICKMCMICQSNFCKNEKIYKLLCGHSFHKNSEECLQDSSIVNWFESSVYCPLCKIDVRLYKP